MKLNFNTNSVSTKDYSTLSLDTKLKTTNSISKSESELNIKDSGDFDVGEENIHTSEVDGKKLQEAIDKINREFKVSNTRIQFKIHEGELSNFDRVSIKVIDESSDKVIIEIPSEEAIEFSEKMHEIIGILFDKSK